MGHGMPENVGQQCKIFCPVGSLYSMLQHLKLKTPCKVGASKFRKPDLKLGNSGEKIRTVATLDMAYFST